MKCSLQLQLTEYEKLTLGNFLESILGTEDLVGSYPSSLNSKITISYDNRLWLLHRDVWVESPPYLYLAAGEDDFPKAKRLAVLLTLTQLVEPSETLTRVSAEAISRYVLGEYNEARSNLVVSKTESTGIAFNGNSVASCIGGEWMLPSGEPVDVSGEEWVVCAAQLPVTTEAELREPVNVNFRIGDRVRFSQIPGIANSSGVGVLVSERHVQVSEGENIGTWNIDHSLLSPVDSGVQF